jgi:GGDEF domain-containing protein
MNSFANNNEKHKQTGEVVIAAGISRFNMDSSVADVFKRADEAMYDNKRLLKEA